MTLLSARIGNFDGSVALPEVRAVAGRVGAEEVGGADDARVVLEGSEDDQNVSYR